MDQLEATVEGTVYRNAENGYSVVTVKPEQKIGLRTVTVVGTLPMLSGGEMGIFSGEWMEHPQYGRQFKCQKVELQRPTTLQGILQRHHPRGWRKNRARYCQLLRRRYAENPR